MSSNGFGSKNAHVVDEDVDFGMAANQILDRLSRPEVAGEADEIAAGFGFERRDRFLNVSGRAAIDDHPRALASEGRGDGCADARGAARHQRPFAVEFEVHRMAYSRRPGRRPRAVWVRSAKMDPPS